MKNPFRGRKRETLAEVLTRSMASQERYQRFGDLEDLRHAIADAELAVRHTPSHHPDPSAGQAILGLACRLWFERTGDQDYLSRATTATEKALSSVGTDHQNWLNYVSQLSVIRLRWYEHTGDLAELDQSIALSEQAAAAPGHEGGHLANLANVLRARFDRTGDLADLRRAISAGERAVAAVTDDSPELPVVLSALCVALQVRFDRLRELPDLDHAIETGARAVTATPRDHPDYAGRLSNLGLSHQKRFEHTGSTADLDRAIELAEASVTASPADEPARSTYLSNLGIALRRRYERAGTPSDVRRAVEVGEQAVATTPEGHPDRPRWQSNLCNGYRALHTVTGDLAHLDRAIEVGEQAVRSVPGDHPELGPWLNNLGIVHQSRYEKTGQAADLDRAIACGQDAVRYIGQDDPRRLPATSLLYLAYQHRVDAGGPGVPRAELAGLAREIGTLTPPSPSHRVQIGRVVGTLANTTGEHDLAAELLASAVRTLPSVAPQELTRGDQENELGDHLGLVSEAVAAHLANGDPVGAVESAELGRGVLLAAALDARSELTELARTDPALAVELSTARDELADLGEQSTYLDRRTRWARYHDLVDRVRHLPGQSRFLLPARLAELRQAAEGGAVVLVNVGRRRGDAVIVTSAGAPVPVRLPDLDHGTVRARAAELRRVTHAAGSFTAALRARRVVTSTLAWLWDTIVGPVVAALPEEHDTRVWWLPTGMLGLFPLHAAGPPEGPGALDRLVSSYIPTLRALSHVRARAAATSRDQLVVALADTPGSTPLPGTAIEAARLVAAHPGARVLSDDAATATNVRAALTTSTWAHFACHASTNLRAPSRGGLHLHGDVLPINEINRLRLDGAELAYLSACSTAHHGWQHADESIHLASAFQLAGYRHVIASLWPVSDATAADAAHAFYDRLPGSPSANDAAMVLRAVTRELRDRHPGRPDLWAPFIHSGP
jgi:CHAT domain-containing protein